MNDSSIGSTTASLKNIVTIVAGLAITNAIVSLFVVNNSADLGNADLQASLLFGLLLLNIIRFHHGNIRHLDTTYTSEPGKVGVTHKPTGSAAKTPLDFFVIFFQALIFALLSFLLRKPGEFVALFTALIAIDVLWYLGVHGMVVDPSSFQHQKKWTMNNVVTLVALLIVIAVGGKIGTVAYFYSSAVVIFANTAVDFWISWPFYFPGAENRGPANQKAI